MFAWSTKWNHSAELCCTKRGFSGTDEWSTCTEGGSEDWDFNIYIYIYMANEKDTCSINTMVAYEKSRGGTHFEVCHCLL